MFKMNKMALIVALALCVPAANIFAVTISSMIIDYNDPIHGAQEAEYNCGDSFTLTTDPIQIVARCSPLEDCSALLTYDLVSGSHNYEEQNAAGNCPFADVAVDSDPQPNWIKAQVAGSLPWCSLTITAWDMGSQKCEYLVDLIYENCFDFIYDPNGHPITRVDAMTSCGGWDSRWVCLWACMPGYTDCAGYHNCIDQCFVPADDDSDDDAADYDAADDDSTDDDSADDDVSDDDVSDDDSASDDDSGADDDSGGGGRSSGTSHSGTCG